MSCPRWRVADRRYPVRVIGHAWIPMDDGVRLGATIYLPDAPGDGPFPALLESIPYRKDDWTLSRDRPVHGHFAARGYASVRLDIRGSGSSEGIAIDEYTDREIEDNLQVLRWLAAQPWCTGRVGMFGLSWGGFSALQAAMRRPPELGAIVPVHFSHDRYATDVHYYGGTLHVGEAVYWPAEMVAENALPPDPERFGPGWHEAWLARLQTTPQWPLTWLRHQRRDEYWRHGSACDDWAALTIPVLAIGGLHDAYREAVLAVLEHGAGPRRGLIGPWGHTWPHAGWPAPSIDGLGEMDRWWDRWLRDERNGADEEPMLRVYVQDPAPAAPLPDRIPGRWWVADRWPLDAPTVMGLGPGEPLDGPGAGVEGSGGTARWHGPLTVGQGAPFWCGSGPPQGVPGDQREDDARSLCYTSQPLEGDLVIIGRPRVRLRLSADQPVAQAAVRLCDVGPDGTSALIARGALNLTHRDGHDHPTALVPGDTVPVAVRLSTAAARVRAGHCLRVAVAGAAWPLAWPAPQHPTLTIHHDPDRPAVLELPLASGMVPDPRPPGPPPDEPDPTGLPEAIDLPARPPAWSVVAAPDGTVAIANEAFEATRLPERGGLEWHGEARYRVALHPDRPDSCVAEGAVGYRIAYPGGPTVEARGSIRQTADAETIHLAIELDVDEDGRRVHEGRWSESFPRDLL